MTSPLSKSLEIYQLKGHLEFHENAMGMGPGPPGCLVVLYWALEDRPGMAWWKFRKGIHGTKPVDLGGSHTTPKIYMIIHQKTWNSQKSSRLNSLQYRFSEFCFFFWRYIDSKLWFCSRQSCWFSPKCNWWIWSYVHQPQVHSQTDETDDFVGVHLLCLTSFPKYSPAAFLCNLPKTNSIFAEHRPKMPKKAVKRKRIQFSTFSLLVSGYLGSWFSSKNTIMHLERGVIPGFGRSSLLNVRSWGAIWLWPTWRITRLVSG